MTIARPVRLLSALALVAGLSLPAVALASGRGGTAPVPKREVRPHFVSGIVATAPATTTAPTTMTVTTVGGINVTVAVSTTTKIVRRYNGASALAEISAGDEVYAWGSFDPTSTATFDAVRIKDWSIQRAYTRVNGVVTGLSSGGVTLDVGKGRAKLSPYRHGETIYVDFSATTVVVSGSVTVTVSDVVTGTHIMALGLFDRVSKHLKADRVRILSDGHDLDRRH